MLSSSLNISFWVAACIFINWLHVSMLSEKHTEAILGMGGGSFSDINFLAKSTTSSRGRPNLLQVRSLSSPLGEKSLPPLMRCRSPIIDSSGLDLTSVCILEGAMGPQSGSRGSPGLLEPAAAPLPIFPKDTQQQQAVLCVTLEGPNVPPGAFFPQVHIRSAHQPVHSLSKSPQQKLSMFLRTTHHQTCVDTQAEPIV